MVQKKKNFVAQVQIQLVVIIIKKNQCCPNGNDLPYQDWSGGSNKTQGVCRRCLLRGPNNSQSHNYTDIQNYHQHYHNDYPHGAKDLDDIIYCNAYYSTKIVNLGRIEMCEDVLFEIEKCITSPSCNIDQYEQLYPEISGGNTTPPYNGVGTGYELSWDQNIWMNIMQETSYQDPVEVIFYLLRCWDKDTLISSDSCKCRPKQLFQRGSGCHERELHQTHDDNISIHPYDLIKELSKIYTEIILTDDDKFAPGHVLGSLDTPQELQYEEYDNTGAPIGNPIESDLVFESGVAKRFSPCGNIGTSGEMDPSPDDTTCTNNPGIPTWKRDYQRIGRPNAIKNIPYFYFGLIAGKTSINKIRNLFFQNR